MYDILNVMNNHMKFYQATIGNDFRQQLNKYNIGIEIDHFCQPENLQGHSYRRSMEEVGAMIEAAGLDGDSLVLHGPFNELHPAAIDPEALALAKKRIDQAYDICTLLGVRKLVLHSGYMPFVYFKSWHRDRSAEFWREFMEGKPQDFTLCIENVLEDEPYMMAELMEALEAKNANIGICLDVGHANCISNVPVSQWIETLAPYIRHFHLHNNMGSKDQHLPFDEGTLKMDDILKQANELCREDTTYTSETINCQSSLKWLKERGYINER